MDDRIGARPVAALTHDDSQIDSPTEKIRRPHKVRPPSNVRATGATKWPDRARRPEPPTRGVQRDPVDHPEKIAFPDRHLNWHSLPMWRAALVGLSIPSMALARASTKR